MGAIVRPYFYKQSTSKKTIMENTMNKKNWKQGYRTDKERSYKRAG